MTPVYIFGIGSPYGDDRAGWRVIEWLEKKSLPETVWRLECCDRPGLRLLSLMESAQSVILIDAVKSGAPPGSVHCWQNADIAEPTDWISSHGFGLADTLRLGKTLDCLPTSLTVYGIEIQDAFPQEETLSGSIEKSARALAEKIFLYTRF